MKKNYIQPQSEIVTFCTGEDIALNIGINETSTIETIDSHKKDWEEDEDIDWEDDYYEE